MMGYFPSRSPKPITAPFGLPTECPRLASGPLAGKAGAAAGCDLTLASTVVARCYSPDGE
ncbi:hypothetical protein PSCLAVI8L_110040 [Pseudoclavibacter sp. 8L]|nr:hypothetical protein PSCLAVI8L_110040 [Pseudoclavibacter sp. 8L]